MRRMILIGAVLTWSLIVGSGFCAAADGQDRNYSSPLVIPAADFSDAGFASDGYEFWPATGYVRGLGYHMLKAPAYLPDGATVTGVTAVLYDNTPSINMQVAMFRCHSGTGSVNQMTLIYSPDSSSIQEVPNPAPISYPTVVYPDYFYYVVVEFAAFDQRLYAVRIDYTD